MEKIQGYQFAIDLDDGGMTRSLRELKNEAKLLKSGMQASFAEIRSGEGIMAAYASKVTDAGRAIDGQRVVIEKLKAEQNGLDQTTAKGREAFVKYENQINSAKRTISSLEAQQERAKQGYETQKSGVLQLKNATELSDKVTESYVGRLKAEGKEFEANKVKAGGLHQAYTNLTKQLQAENTELDRVASASGKNSRQYQEQQVRVNELGAKIAETRTKMKELDSQLEKKPRSGLSSVIGQLDKVNEHAGKVDHIFGKIFGARLLASGVISAWQSLTSHIGEAIKAGQEYDKEQQKMTATWTTLTGNAKDGQAMVDVTNKLSVAMGQDVDVTDELNQQFYHVLDKKGPTETLTKSVLTMGDAVGLSSDNVKNLGLNFTHMMSSSKMQLGDFNHITDALPMYGEALLKYEQKVQKNSKLTMSALRGQMSAGKISAKDAENVMNELGNKYKEASDNLMKTIPGMERVIKARVPALLGDIQKPLMQAQNPIYGAVSKWVSDKRTEKEFTKVGVAANKGITVITKAFAKAFDVKSAPKAMDDAMNGLANGVTTAANAIAKNAPEITDFFKTVKNLGGVGFQTLIESLKLTNTILKPLLSLVGGHTETIAKFGAAWWVANKAIKGTSTVLSTFKKVSDGISWASKVFGIKSETKALQEQNEVLKTNVELSEAEGTSVGGSSSGGASGKVYKEITSVGGNVSKEAEELTRVEKYGSKAGMLSKIGGRLKSLKSISGAGKALVGSTGVLDVLMAGTDLIGTNKKNVGDHVGGAAGNLGGAALGGTIGTLIAPGIGTAIGAGIGSMGGDKIGRLLGSKIQKGLDDNKPKVHVVQPKPVKIGVTTDTKKIESKLSGYNKKLSKAMVVKMSADPASYAKTQSQTDKLFTQMRGSVSKYYKDKESKSKKDLDQLVKNGSMTQKEEDATLKKQKSADSKAAQSKLASINKMQKDTQSYYKQVQSIENGGTKKLESIAQKYGRNSKQYENEKNKELSKAHKSYINQYTADEYKLNTVATKAVSKGATQQKSILSKLIKDRGKLNTQDLNATKKNADAKYKAAVTPARKTRDQVVDSANSQYKSSKKIADHEYTDLHEISKKQYEAIVSKAKKQRDDTDDAANDQYKKVTKHATDQHNSVRSEIEKQRKQVVKEAQTQNSSVSSEAYYQQKYASDSAEKQRQNIGKAWKSMTKTVGGWLGGIAHNLNTSAKHQNESFKQYGGSGTTLSTSIPESYPTKQYATGTGIFSALRKSIDVPTYAMLNDGNDSPETGNRELAFLPNGNVLAPEERNWTGILPAGTEVANASESKLLAPWLGIEHFKTGTGLVGAASQWVKGIWGSLMSRVKAASSILTNSDKTWGSMFSITDNDKKGSLAKTYTQLTKTNFNRAGKAWWHEAWSQINGAINADSDSGSGDGSLRPHFGSPFKESSGYGPRSGDVTDNHKGIDYSAPMGTPIPAQYAGKVVTAGSASGFGNWVVIRPDGADINTIYGHMKSFNVHAGEHVKEGQTIAHVGAEGEATGPHVHYELRKGLGSGDSRPNPMTYKVDLKGSDSKDKSKSKSSTGLSGLVRKELGPGLFSWISKNLAPLVSSDGGSIDSFGLSGSLASRARKLASALKSLDSSATKNGIAAILGNWSFESGLNAGSVNTSGGASGLGQWLGVRKSNLIAFAKRKGKSWKDPSVQLEFALNGDGSDSTYLRKILHSNDSVSSLATSFSENWERGGYTSQHVAGATKVASALKGYENGGIGNKAGLYPLFEGNKQEAVVPMDLSKRSRAYQVMQQIMGTFAGQDRPTAGTDTATLNAVVKQVNSGIEDRFDTMLAMMGQLLNLNANQITAIKAGAFDKTQMYKQQGYDQALADAQSFRG